jgi:hypothetical protein
MIAPGNIIRGKSIPVEHELLYSLIHSTTTSVDFLLKWLPQLLLCCLFFIEIIYENIALLKNKNFLINPILVFFFGFSILFFGFFTGFWVTKNILPDRAINTIYFFFIATLIYFVICSLYYLDKKHNFVINTTLSSKLALGILIVTFMFSNTPIYNAYHDLTNGKAYNYNKEMNNRLLILLSSKKDTIIVPSLKNQPQTIFKPVIMGLTTDVKNWKNEEISEYYNKIIVVQPTDSIFTELMDITEFLRLKDKNLYHRHPWEVSRKNVLHQFLKQSKISFPIKRIVDIGGGDGYIINSLFESNLAEEYYAIDTAYNENLINQLTENYVNNKIVYLNNLEDYYKKSTPNEGTLFLCMDVLEHLKEENEILSYLQNENDSYFFFAVPAFQSIFSYHDELLGHYRRYSLSELESVLKNHNFQIKDKGYYFTSLLLFRKIEILLKKKRKETITEWNGNKFKVSLLFKKVGINLPGLSCYCLCKK